MSEPTQPGESSNTNISVPLKLDAFVLNPEVCNGQETDAKIAPITQPNYTFLRLTNFIVQNDILNPVDLHSTTPPQWNSRLTDLGSGARRENRQGVYVHWMLPRVYRSGTAATESGPDNRQKDGLPEPADPDNSEKNVPQFRLVPSRWLVIRRIHEGTAFPANSGIPELQAWVVESDRKYDIKTLGPDVDLQTDVSPFVYPTRQVNIEQQAEVFIGARFPAKEWKESEEPVDRVPLSLLNGGNILFADYQIHNSNVFSIVDNFSYPDPQNSKKKLYLERATASYYVIGWHPDDKEDPFYIPQPAGNDPSKTTRGNRLSACQMMLNDTTTAKAKAWLESTESARVVCHGAMYSVEWDLKKKPKKVLADSHSHHLNNKLPVAVGTTPLDSLLAYIHAHDDGEGDEAVKQLIANIIQIQTLLMEQDDAVDAQRQAEDLLYNYHFDAVSGGTHYYLSGSRPDSKPAKPPSPETQDDLASLNQEQYRLDLIERTKNRVQWELFSSWWKYISDGQNDQQNLKHESRLKVAACMKKWKDLNKWAGELKKTIKEKVGTLRIAEPGVLPSFHMQRDPTLLVGGIESGWPHDWLDKLKVRLDEEITAWADPITNPSKIDWTEVRDEIIPKLPDTIQDTAKALIGEFFQLASNNDGKGNPAGTHFPVYHDQGVQQDANSEAPWRDRWESTQPWFPLFMEWEVEYTHIPFPDNWSLEERATTRRPGETMKLRYGIKDGVKLSDPDRPNKDDKRILSGRVLILPQPNFSLESKIKQLFENTPTDILDKIIRKEKRDQIINELHRLAFLSAPLAGLHDHLLTMVQGTHIKPNMRHAGEKLLPIEAALDPDAGFTRDQFEIMGTETDLTPYGTLVQFYNFPHSAFKPVTHGQFKFTKLNIIDKFGQAIHAIDPKWSATGPPPVYPCISEFYAPQILEGNIPNTVEYNEFCEFVQMPPHINQLARLNAAFVERDDKDIDKQKWVRQSEWQNPIWGWIVINYAEYGIQIFLPDGTFFREVRLGGRLGAATSDEWLPFARPEKEASEQLDHLVRKLGDSNYLRAFVDMINESLANAAPAPSAYAQFLNSVVGKPLALVNMAWSLELATDAYENQSTLNQTKPDRWLLSDHNDPGRELYEFKFKLGDKDRAYDGLVGYFETLKNQEKGNDLKLDKLYTFFGQEKPESPLVMIGKNNYPTLKPYFLDPATSAKAMDDRRNNYLGLNTFGAIVDPFTPVHGYSGILPTQPLKLPTWTWQEALGRMTAFFHMGPLVVTQDVPEYKPEYKLKSNYNLNEATTVPGSAVATPALPIADWNWLQPYTVETDGQKETVFAPLGLGTTDSRPRFEEGPYTTLEGYLQLRRPIVRAE